MLASIQNFNQSWKFKRADVSGAEATAFDDSSWADVGLPHSFDLPYFMSSKFYVGYGWYRKHFTVPSSWSGKSVFLEFQAAFDQAQIYVNGKQVGEHIGGYNGFSIDITSAIKTGDNVVAVRLNNNWNAQLPPITGDHTFQGGLYRNVFVVVTDPLHVAWYGTWVTTPTLATNSGSSSTVADQDRGAEQPLGRRQRHAEDRHRGQGRQGGHHHFLAAADRRRQDGDLRPDHARHQQPLAVASRPSHDVQGAVLPFRRQRDRGQLHDAVRVPLVQLVGDRKASP